LETGLPGNIFLHDYTRFEILATHSWFKTFWQYLDHFDVKFEIDEELTIPPMREQDQVFMDLVTKLLPWNEWRQANRVRKYHKIYFISQLVHVMAYV
jgi:hypothetical protein